MSVSVDAVPLAPVIHSMQAQAYAVSARNTSTLLVLTYQRMLSAMTNTDPQDSLLTVQQNLPSLAAPGRQ